jgi:hypothetical protein
MRYVDCTYGTLATDVGFWAGDRTHADTVQIAG